MDHLTSRGEGGVCFFSKKNILILVEEKNNNLVQFLSYNLMLNSGKKQKNKYTNSRLVRKKNSERKKNP